MDRPIATIKRTKEIQEKYNVFTKKSYGQNFIIEPRVVEKIADAAIKSFRAISVHLPRWRSPHRHALQALA